MEKSRNYPTLRKVENVAWWTTAVSVAANIFAGLNTLGLATTAFSAGIMSVLTRKMVLEPIKK